MSDDWLWDGSGKPDADQARAEALLRTFRYVPPRRASRWRWAPLVAGLLAAAASLLVVRAMGTPEVAWSCGEGCSLAVGAWLTPSTDVRLEVADIGTMDVAKGSRLRLVGSSEEGHRLQLDGGRIYASVVAPPRLLVVDTPSAAAVDLGCAYDLTVLDDGSALLIVDSGEVSLEAPGRSTWVPEGAAAMTFPGHGPTPPWYADADPAFAEALVAFDRTGVGLEGVLAGARPRDALSLWHLLPRVERPQRDGVLDRIEALGPTVLDRGRLLELDPEELDRLRYELAHRG